MTNTTWRGRVVWPPMEDVCHSLCLVRGHDVSFSNTSSIYRFANNLFAGIFGPAATKWFGFLVSRVNLPSKNGTIIARVACDQFLFAPVNMTVFLSSMAYMEGNSPTQRLKDAFVPGYQKNLMIWPWVQFVNFKYVPAEMRVLVVNIISLGKSHIPPFHSFS